MIRADLKEQNQGLLKISVIDEQSLSLFLLEKPLT
ncbi:MAG: hypothetical protein QG627_1011 [Chlamydiota bacterium]|nr:hypothetical protein [Chlamydiota bacterium]